MQPARREPALVIYVESNADTVRLVTLLLEATSRYRVLAAADGVAGLDLVQQHHPAAVLLDLDLPLIDGFELCRRIRADDASRELPLIVISASVMNSERQRSLAAGCQAFIEKPFDLPELVQALDHATGAASSGRGSG
jgi:CheY-like chemotaxis protein